MKTVLSLVFLLVTFGACSSTRVGAGAADINSARTIRGDEWIQFAEDFNRKLSASEAFKSAIKQATPEIPLVLGIDDFHIKTSDVQQQARFSTDRLQMYNALQEQLVNQYGGRLVVNVEITGDKADESERSTLINNVREGTRGSVEYDQTTAPKYGGALAPTFGIQGVIISTKTSADSGKAYRFDYQVSLKMIDLQRNVLVWQGVVPFPKSFEPGWIGF